MDCAVTGEAWPAPEGAWLPGGGIKILWKYFIYSCEEHCESVRGGLKAVQQWRAAKKEQL